MLGRGSMNIINIVAKEVEGACRSKNNVFGYGVWSHHIISVVEYAKIMAIDLGADVEVVQLAALLHDYAGIKDYSMYKEHHIHGCDEAEKILSFYGYPAEKIDLIKECIFCHRGSIDLNKNSLEAICLADADAIAHIENVPSLLYLAYHNKNLSIEEGSKWVADKIDRSYNKLSEYGREIIEQQYYSTRKFLSIA